MKKEYLVVQVGYLELGIPSNHPLAGEFLSLLKNPEVKVFEYEFEENNTINIYRPLKDWRFREMDPISAEELQRWRKEKEEASSTSPPSPSPLPLEANDFDDGLPF